ncbi:cyclopropane-fatty-acyl-phospholipid synthase family protein [Siccirubricoccus sp. KC 17139]|uniref:Cyclopropane-fatty-acyl-phospholipid synthase family protein n=1 Tax=Siccirubricoccus soli TaxID=2899147 RepID=A0ABT1DC91_9PROT|nr:cyclopropane-fatty-acyl-phospholipid synthase family protein [Siccirubricoccus soli]MCO6419548.1 cyclopropane-fatty-acyl-phospholipid synthase family protein [Siccirubricoccus soli]MCP2685683.1 cyclopropane-fatty-acyl-phospholipid synthase family protein [Siccirubricoccus soli]
MLLHLALNRLIRTGTLTVRYPDGAEHRYGGGPGPSAGMHIRDWKAARRLALDPALAGGELYMEERLAPLEGDLYDLVEVFMLNLETEDTPATRLLEQGRRLVRRLAQYNPAGRARRNVAHHYDLDSRLFRLILDADQQYSCAYFPTGRETLEEAQAAKKRHIAAKLCLDRPGLEVLDIGCGWGGMALTLAREWGARVTGLTLSTEQLGVARARAAEAGLADRVRFELLDYRAWGQPVDRIVSVGMFEHVGIGHYPAFFETVRRALRPDGVALIHAIGRAAGPAFTNPWLAKYIFPGGYSPALSEVLPAAERSGLWVTDIEILRLHYAETLRHWRRRFAANRETIRALYDERFCRMFEFYLVGCELAFRRSDHMVWQMQVARDRAAVPLTRDYITAAEQAAVG